MHYSLLSGAIGMHNTRSLGHASQFGKEHVCVPPGHKLIGADIFI